MNLYDPIIALRQSTPDRRKDAALEVARMMSDDAVHELIRMVEARRRLNFTWYNLDDQMIGVEALGETKNRRALDYLMRVYSSVKKDFVHSEMLFCGGSDAAGDAFEECVLYSRDLVRKDLSNLLRYTGLEYRSGFQNSMPLTNPQLQVPPQHIVPKNEAVHTLFTSSIAKLEEALGIAPSKPIYP